MTWLDTDPAGIQYRDMLRKKFRPDAEIILYACHAGIASSTLLLVDLATTLLVKASGFADEIRYDPHYVTAVKAQKATKTTPAVKGQPAAVLDRASTHYQTGASQKGFKHLIPDKHMPRPPSASGSSTTPTTPKTP